MRLGGKKNLLFIYAEPRNEGGLMAKSWGKGLRSVDTALWMTAPTTAMLWAMKYELA